MTDDKNSEACTSTYTVDFDTGEKLTCSGNHPQGTALHKAPAYGMRWYWHTSEEDK